MSKILKVHPKAVIPLKLVLDGVVACRDLNWIITWYLKPVFSSVRVQLILLQFRKLHVANIKRFRLYARTALTYKTSREIVCCPKAIPHHSCDCVSLPVVK